MTRDDAVTVARKPGIVTTPRTAAFWSAANEGILLLQHCESCGHLQHYARAICGACWSDQLAWRRSAGRGAVWTFTVIGIPGHPAWKVDVPYVVAVVELDEGPRLLTGIVECEPDAVYIGQRVRLHPTWQADTEQTLLTFRPDTAGRAVSHSAARVDRNDKTGGHHD